MGHSQEVVFRIIFISHSQFQPYSFFDHLIVRNSNMEFNFRYKNSFERGVLIDSDEIEFN